ncbi:MAG: STAS domain-containing protein [Bryobacteraceae bacterium]|nr:STAS domain-containing protein [Bryobacteraceae bacterium]MDW8379657.1 STAS domain-containing protein [Bryobacterales bacterium]
MLVVTHNEVSPDTVLVRLQGRLMLGEDTAQLDSLVNTLLASGYKRLVFDLTLLTHIDSTGIGRFIAIYNKVMATEGASLAMAAATGAVRSAFRVTKLDTVFQFFDTVEAALASI